MTPIEQIDRMRDIALKCFRGNPAINRDGYREAGLVDELDQLREDLALALQQPETAVRWSVEHFDNTTNLTNWLNSRQRTLEVVGRTMHLASAIADGDGVMVIFCEHPR